MNIEIANRLVKLRKEKNLSQETLANALGISRQAVSKWERAESSPDTDNLIMLAKLYDISLDELLNSDQEKFESGKSDQTEDKKEEKKQDNYVRISFKEGIRIKDDDEEVSIGWSGIHVKEGRGKDQSEVNISSDGVFIDGEQYSGNWRNGWKGCNNGEWDEEWDNKKSFPFFVIAFAAYMILGIQYHAWHPGWLIFLTVPIFHMVVSMFRYRSIMYFPYPLLVILYIGYHGFVNGVWYPYWLSIFSIPVFYSIFGYIHHKFKYRKD